MTHRIEEPEDGRAMRLALAGAKAGERVYLPLESVLRMNRGEHPVRVWREFRGLTLTALARKAALPQGYLSEIETGKKPGSVRAFKALASALDATVDDLTP
jgi:Helix-turn-helix domain